MPRGRFGSRDLSTNKKYWKLDDTHGRFWSLLFLWCDAEGRQDGDPAIIKGLVCPLADWTVEQVEEMLVKFEGIKRHDGLGWIERYHRDGKYVLWCVGFEENQQGLRKEKEAKGRYGWSDFPPPPAKLMRMYLAGKEMQAVSPLDTPVSGVSEQKLAEMAKYWEDNIKQMITPPIADRLKGWAEEYPTDQFKKAVDIAVKRKAKSPAPYVDKILLTQEFDNGSSTEQTPKRDTSEGFTD